MEVSGRGRAAQDGDIKRVHNHYLQADSRSADDGQSVFAGNAYTGRDSRPGGGSTPWISGGRNASSEILIDGNTAIVPENNVSINDGGYTPVIDSVEELTVIKNSMAAEYGRSGRRRRSQQPTRSGTQRPPFWLVRVFPQPCAECQFLEQQPERG